MSLTECQTRVCGGQCLATGATEPAAAGAVRRRETNLRMVPPPSASATAAGATSREAARARCPACCSSLVGHASWSLLLLPCCCFCTPAGHERATRQLRPARHAQVGCFHAEIPRHTMCGCILGAGAPRGQSICDADVVCPACRQPAPALLVQTAAPLLVVMQGGCLHVGGLLFREQRAAAQKKMQANRLFAVQQPVGVQDNGRQ